MTEVKPENPHGLSAMQEKVLSQAEQLLRAIGAQYVIKLGAFNVSTMRDEAPAKKTRKSRTLTHPVGTYTMHIDPVLKELKPGEMATIPINGFDTKSLMNNVSTYCNKRWGAGTYLAEVSRDGTGIEVLRNPE